MIVVLAIDALEFHKVEEFNCSNLKQKKYGKTNISEFSQPRTMVLWSSFMTGLNKEKEVLADGKEMWNKKWGADETFFSKFKKPVVIDLPGFSYDLKAHERSRGFLKEFFEAKNPDEKETIRKKYNDDALKHHGKVKKQFLDALESDSDFVLGYFSVIDVIGHLNFGNNSLMKMLYKELDDIAKLIIEKGHTLLVLSDHGMKAVGRFGDHSDYGFWSTSFDCGLSNPKITDFSEFIENEMRK